MGDGVKEPGHGLLVHSSQNVSHCCIVSCTVTHKDWTMSEHDTGSRQGGRACAIGEERHYPGKPLLHAVSRSGAWQRQGDPHHMSCKE